MKSYKLWSLFIRQLLEEVISPAAGFKLNSLLVQSRQVY